MIGTEGDGKWIMTFEKNKKWMVTIGCLSVVLSTLLSGSVKAEVCIPFACKLPKEGATPFSTYLWLSAFTTTAPTNTTTMSVREEFSKYFIQAMKDDAAAYVATDGSIEGPALESAWRMYSQDQLDFQPSKNEFARMVLATY